MRSSGTINDTLYSQNYIKHDIRVTISLSSFCVKFVKTILIEFVLSCLKNLQDKEKVVL